MYIADTYWDHWIGDTDDSLTLVEYLAGKQKERIPFGELFSEIGLDRLNGDFRQHEEPLAVAWTQGEQEEMEAEFHYAILVIADLAALLLECRVSGSVNLNELAGQSLETDVPKLSVTATPEEHKLLNEALKDFVSDPMAYDLSEMESEEDMLKLAGVCEALRKELYG